MPRPSSAIASAIFQRFDGSAAATEPLAMLATTENAMAMRPFLKRMFFSGIKRDSS